MRLTKKLIFEINLGEKMNTKLIALTATLALFQITTASAQTAALQSIHCTATEGRALGNASSTDGSDVNFTANSSLFGELQINGYVNQTRVTDVILNVTFPNGMKAQAEGIGRVSLTYSNNGQVLTLFCGT